jgi:hypothetical protein
MSKQELKQEIGRILDQFSDKALAQLLAHLEYIVENSSSQSESELLLDKIITEDRTLLEKLAH